MSDDKQQLTDDQLEDMLTKYKGIVEKYIPDSAEDHYFLRSLPNNILPKFHAVYLEVLVDLNGNEDDFKRCLRLAKAPEKKLHSYDGEIEELRTNMIAYAQLIMKNK